MHRPSPVMNSIRFVKQYIRFINHVGNVRKSSVRLYSRRSQLTSDSGRIDNSIKRNDDGLIQQVKQTDSMVMHLCYSNDI